MKKFFLITTLTGLTFVVSYPQLHGVLDTSKLRMSQPVFNTEWKLGESFNQTVMSDSFVYKKDTKDFSAECGIENRKEFSRLQIYGGQETKPNQWPWQVAVISDTGFCGGSLISDEWVMTAAHYSRGSYEFHVIAGAHKLWDHDDPHPQEIISHKVIIPNIGDIALIKLPEKITFNKYMKPVCLPARNQDASLGDRMTVTGWGETENGAGSLSDVLRMVEQTIITNQECDGRGGFICTSAEGHKGICYGDSGGPLVKKSNGKWIQHGIVSFLSNPECGTGYMVFRRVTFFLDWIETITGIMIH